MSHPAPLAARLRSIDALRGFDMFWIIGGDALFQALSQWLNLPVLETQMEHVKWEGFRFYDLIFPLFVFIVGIVLPFSLSKYHDDPAGRRAEYFRILRRTALLLIFGYIYWGNLQKPLADVRWMGVLQRIGLCYLFAGLAVMHLRARGLAVLTAALLLGYWAIMTLVPVPGFAAGDLTMQGNLAAHVDRLLIPGKFCCYTFGDNEGLLSTIPAIGTALLGALTGLWLRSGRSQADVLKGLLVGAAALLVVGLGWGQVFPIIKNLWTSSYVLVAGGCSLGLVATFYYLIEIRGWHRFSFPFEVIGVNAITIYLAHRVIGFERISAFLLGNLAGVLGQAGPVLLALGALTIEWFGLRYLYGKGTRLKV